MLQQLTIGVLPTVDMDAAASLIESLLGPSARWWASQIYHAVVSPLLAERFLAPPFVATAIAIAAAYYLWQKRGRRSDAKLLELLFPKEVFLHRSAKLDYKFFVVNQILNAHLGFGKLIIGVVGLLGLSKHTALALKFALGEPSSTGGDIGFSTLALFTVANLMAADFGRWVAHFLAHKIPVLWEFHKVHHAEEVLTPISGFRSHPCDVMVDFFFRLLFTGIVSGIFMYFYPAGITELTILGFNALAFLIYYPLANLQHSHVPLSYGAFNRILIGPVMHQVHHSCESQHWDRNYGFTFGIWDWMFGTLHIPAPGEKLTLGLPPGKGAGEYTTLRELYFRPFLGIWRLVTGGRRPAPTV